MYPARRAGPAGRLLLRRKGESLTTMLAVSRAKVMDASWYEREAWRFDRR